MNENFVKSRESVVLKHLCKFPVFGACLGLPKHFEDIVLPSIRSEILAHNPGCDVFAHTYNVTTWAVTKAGSRRRRGYNMDSSWTEAALSRWLVHHGRSAS